jgi:hypothetical protein
MRSALIIIGWVVGMIVVAYLYSCWLDWRDEAEDAGLVKFRDDDD